MVEIENTRPLEDGKPEPLEGGKPGDGQAAVRGGRGEGQPPRLFAWLASLATILALIAGQFLARGDHAILRGVGVAVLALSGVLIFAPFFLLGKQGRGEGGGTYMQTGAVVDRGLYALVRHPQYLGYMLLAAGFALLSQHWLAVLLAVVGVACFYLQAVLEERYCLARFGEAYAVYLRRVPRFNLVLGALRLFLLLSLLLAA